jgi:DNA repair protein RadC
MQEQFVLLLLNQANKPLGIYKASTGGITGTMADIRLIMVAALKSLASGIIFSLNLPSGIPYPSEQDFALTKQIKEACKIISIALLDHIIVTAQHDFFSFANEGML